MKVYWGVPVRLFTTIAALQCYLEQYKNDHCQGSQSGHGCDAASGAVLPEIGLVPTMGALHAGHLSLIQRARQENTLVVVSLFVNPLQFGPSEDFQRYPRTLEQDQALCEQAGVDVLFAPAAEEMGVGLERFGLPPTQVVPPEVMTSVLCGKFRPGHFQGVATIVTKLLSLVQPDRAYFGQKDAQQLAIIQRLVVDLNLPVEIVPCPIVREANGLALSSRNAYLTETERAQAAVIYQGLRRAEACFRSGERLSSVLVGLVKEELGTVPAIQPEYVELVHPRTLAPLEQIETEGLLAVAVRLGSTRLIDNCHLRTRKPIIAIDGPAGAGKSTVARKVAQALGLLYLDTGAMYRALTWLVLQSGLAIDDEPAVAELLRHCEISVGGLPTAVRVEINGQEVTQAIRSLEVTSQVSAIAAQPAVRRALVRQQRRYGLLGGLVAEGRDIGTCVFPDAELKIFLTASVQERARRRQQDLKHQGQGEVDLDTLEQAIFERDRKDSTRRVAPLRQAADAIEIQSDQLTIAAVVEQIIQLYQGKISLNA